LTSVPVYDEEHELLDLERAGSRLDSEAEPSAMSSAFKDVLQTDLR
jgi:hypothetical protein